MFSWETCLTNGAIGAAFVASIGEFFNMDPNLVLFGVAVAGSLASVGFRWLGGHLKDWKQRGMAFVSGVLLAVVATPYLYSRFGLEGLEAGVFVLVISIVGARVVKWLSTDFDIADFLSRMIDKLSGGNKGA